MHLTYAKMIAIVMRENMKLGGNTLNNERVTFDVVYAQTWEVWALKNCIEPP